MTKNSKDTSGLRTRRSILPMPTKPIGQDQSNQSTDLPISLTETSTGSTSSPVGNKDVGRQRHYEQYDIQPIDFIVQVAGPEWCAGNIIKYAARYKEKNGVEDVYKAKQYCQFLINILEGRDPRDNGTTTSETAATES